MAFLKFNKENNLRSYQLTGNYENYLFSLIKAPNDSVLTFYCEFETNNIWTSLIAKKVKIENGIKTILQTIDLSTELTLEQIDNKVYHNAQDLLTSNLSAGIWYLEIKNLYETLQSELFCVNDNFNIFTPYLLTNNGKLLTNKGKLLVNYKPF